MKFSTTLVRLICVLSLSSLHAADFNARILTAIRSMPTGGSYDGSDATKNLLATACTHRSGKFLVDAHLAQPSFCSGATYLVLLKALGTGSPALLPQPDQKDGHGAFGRWNANGPGAAKLITDLRAGENFTSWEAARPGDFLKIWWTEPIGQRERGHLVIFLSSDPQTVRFWSSNQPGGYGEKTVPRSSCQRVLFTRITHPEKFAAIAKLPPADPWLARMLTEDFSWPEITRTTATTAQP